MPRLLARLATAESEAAGIPDMVSRIESGRVRLVVNTPTPRSGAIRDAAEIRHAAIAEGVLCLTAIETAIAAAEALDPEIADRIADVRSLGSWLSLFGSHIDRLGGARLPDVVGSTSG